MMKSVRTNIYKVEKKLFESFIRLYYPRFFIGDYTEDNFEYLCYAYSTTFTEEVDRLVVNLLKYGSLDKEYISWKSKQTWPTATVI